MRTDIFVPAAPPVAIPLRDVLPWLAFAGILAVVSVYFVGAEQGGFAILSGNLVHEFLHDGRHLLAFPCH